MQWARGSFTSGSRKGKIQRRMEHGAEKDSARWKILILWACRAHGDSGKYFGANPRQGYRVAVLRGGPGGETRYRPLGQINASNFNDLEIAWRIKTDNFGDRPGIQTGRDAADGQTAFLYATAGIAARAVIALDPAHG